MEALANRTKTLFVPANPLTGYNVVLLLLLG